MNELLKNIFYPFGTINKKIKVGIIIFWVASLLIIFELFNDKIIPTPSKIFFAILTFLQSPDFYDDLLKSFMFTINGMGIAIFITMIIVYMSTTEFIKPLAELITKCRYLTLTGLIYLFTFLSNNIGDLKMKILLFGIIPFFVTSFFSIVHKDVPQSELDKAYVNKKNKWETLLEIVIVGRADKLLEVIRQNFAISWMMITTAEGYAMNEGGLGTLIIKGNKHLDLSEVFAILVIILLLGVVFDYLLSILRTFLFPYTKK